ncbi:MAG TPA: iron-containing alcohol dehydrogenase [Bryobacteraceae bacterium]|nr:iron-containing alcohol dehydrogenase [Bryobacteraceae bacterium]
MISTFSFPTRILFGPGAIERLPKEMEQRGMKRPLLVTDGGLAATAVFARVRKLVPEGVVFTKVDANPTEQNVLDGAELYGNEGCDSVIGLGGGSPLDAAKAIRLKVTHPLSLAEYDDLIDGWKRISSDVPPFIAVATTAGTGSEVGRSTVITIEKTNRKTVIFSPYLIPSVAVTDPELTLDLPPPVTAGTGMDAFTHNVETYLSKGFHPICDAIALEGARLASENLPRVMAQPRDLEARGGMLMSSMMGAIAFQKGLGAAHSLAHPLSTEFGMHHGTANAVVLPYVLEFNRSVSGERLAALARQCGVPDLIARTVELNRLCGIAPRLRDYGVPEDALGTLASKAIEDGCHQLNPRPCTVEDLLSLYRQAW